LVLQGNEIKKSFIILHKRKKTRNKKSVILPKIQIADNFFEKNLDKLIKKEYTFYRLARANSLK
jgi:hypothetical protein